MVDEENTESVEKELPDTGEVNTAASEAEDEDDVTNPDGDALEAGSEGEDQEAEPQKKAPYINESDNRFAAENAELRARAQAAEQRWQSEQSERQRKEEEARERELLASFTPEERAEYRAAKAEQHIQGIAQRYEAQMNMRTREHNDRVAFMEKATSNPLYQKNMRQVEEQANALAQQGKFLPREVLLDLQLARQMRNASQKGGAAKQRKRGAENMEKSKAASTGRKGDVSSSGAKKGDNKETSFDRLLKSGAITRAEHARMSKTQH